MQLQTLEYFLLGIEYLFNIFILDEKGTQIAIIQMFNFKDTSYRGQGLSPNGPYIMKARRMMKAMQIKKDF